MFQALPSPRSEVPKSTMICLFVLRFNVPVNNFSVMSGWSHRFLDINLYHGDVSCSRTQLDDQCVD